MKIKVSELIVRYLERLGVKTIFGMPGAHILPVYDSLYDSSIQSVLAKHEQGAAFMAGGCARASGKISACITTAGPGATNLVTGIANAYADKLPVIIITGEAPTYIFGKGGLQESSGEGGSIDQFALFKGITRYNKVIERTDYLENVLNQVSKILLSDSSGPVLLSFPYNVQKEMVDDTILDAVITERKTTAIRNNTLPARDFTQIINEANRPVIIAGHGCIKADAQQEVDQLSEYLNIPVTTSLKGKGVISEQSERSLGSLGVTSYSEARNYIVEQADLLIFLGASFNERTSYLWDKKLLENRKIIQVDTCQEQLEKVFKADLPILGDIKQVIAGVLQQIKAEGIQKKRFSKAQHENPTGNDARLFNERFSLIRNFFNVLEKHFPEDIMVFDDNIIFAQNFFSVSNGNRYYSNSGISSLGHAIPAAIGARFAIKHPTLAILGDGGFQMCCMELMTAVNYNIPLTVVMFNNATMGLIRKNQFQQYEKRFIDCDFINPDYQLLAASFGIEYRKVESNEDLNRLFEKIDYNNNINLIEIIIDKDLFPTYSSRR
ncbi:Acetolactate synthase large subunit [hydrothermal vent metagenome]|uniref:Acetolactate synthase large subunit n=1 Tax=hydrothermal vent metagenome TaxID=652676 RepID=A0A3B0WPR4_9ZZZZ